MRHDPDDPALLKPHERLRELAAILALGIQRCRTSCPVPQLRQLYADVVGDLMDRARHRAELLAHALKIFELHGQGHWVLGQT